MLITAEGDGPGGSHALLAYHPATDTIVVGLVNDFGLFDEMEFLLEKVLPEVLGPAKVESADATTSRRSSPPSAPAGNSSPDRLEPAPDPRP